jgi:NADH:ubiquinone oxidoreductase subunit 3 (subunit A)
MPSLFMWCACNIFIQQQHSSHFPLVHFLTPYTVPVGIILEVFCGNTSQCPVNNRFKARCHVVDILYMVFSPCCVFRCLEANMFHVLGFRKCCYAPVFI